MIPIGGLVPFTTIDFPGALAAVIFCQGCPWRCGYCHNTHLQSFEKNGEESWEEVLAFLERRKRLLEAVVFSGGEPSLHPHLPEAIREIKNLGYRIGLHTAGISPARLKIILPLIDWVGMDIKAPFSKYEKVTQRKNSGSHAQESARLVIASGVDYTFRTTVHPKLLSEEDLQEIRKELQSMGARSYVLQPFRKEGCKDQELIETASLKIKFDSFCREGVQQLFKNPCGVNVSYESLYR